MKPSLEQLGGEAYRYLLPLYEMHATRARMLRSGLPTNTWRHVRTLPDARARLVTTPNPDTLFSSAWLELSQGLTISLPPTGGRYLSVALMDAFSNNFAVVRGEPDSGRVVQIVGPGAPNAEGVLQAPTSVVWALARTLVARPQELDAAHLLQDGLSLRGDPPVSLAPDKLAPREDISSFFETANALLKETEFPAADGPVLRRLAAIGVGPGLAYPPETIAAHELKQIERGAREALASLQFGDGITMGGWIHPRATLGDFGEDYAYRASIALTGLAALPLSEATYLKAAGQAGDAVYEGGSVWSATLHPEALCMADGFWSLTLYELTSEGQLFLFDNPWKRYAIGSSTPGLVCTDRGEVEITISSTPPRGSQENWLPAPCGNFALQLRAFRPTEQLRTGAYRPDAVRERKGPIPGF